MAARLKVFITSDGLTDYVVAASSRPKALQAWGVNQDLFKEGRARESDDAALAKAALAQPGAVLTRPAGGRAGALQLPKAAPRPARKAGPSPAQKRRLAALERQLDELEARHDRDQEDLAADRAALEAREQRIRADFDARHAALRGEIATARRAAGL